MSSENFDALTGSLTLTTNAIGLSKGNFVYDTTPPTSTSKGITATVDATAGRGGSPAVKFSEGAGPGVVQAIYGGTTGVTMSTMDLAMRGYFRCSGTPGLSIGSGTVPDLMGTGYIGYGYGWVLFWAGGGSYEIYDDASTNSTNFSVADGNWFRVEAQCSVAGPSLEVRVFYGANLETSTPSVTHGPYTQAATAGWFTCGYGVDAGYVVDGGNFGSAYIVLDDVECRQTLGWIGPAGSAPATQRQGWGITRV